MTRIALALMLVFAMAPAVAKEAALYKTRDCSKLQTQTDLNICAQDNLDSANAALNALYAKVMADPDNAQSKTQLKDLERAWMTYRDKECAWEAGPQEGGGSIWGMEMSNCLEAKTAIRIRELRQKPACLASPEECTY